jgi:flagella basal body P-ring formation protein FlgA
MPNRTIAWLLFAIFGVSGAEAECMPVSGNRIAGRDLALADKRFSALPATLTVGFAPAPGARRLFDVAELQRLARANAIPAEGLTDICFELTMHPLKAEDAITAMRQALPSEVTLKIVELPAVEVPAGKVAFPLPGLEPPLESNHRVQLWRGDVTYAETRHTSIWARVEVTAQYKAVVATKDLSAGAPIDDSSLRIETRSGPLAREKPANSIEDVRGRILKRAIKAGAPIPLAVLAEPPDVHRGDAVSVEVQSGPAHLRFEAIAETSARDGELVELRNPLNGKSFRAKLSPDGRAVIVINAGRKL